MQDFSFTIKMARPEPDNARTIFHVAQSFYLAGNRAALNIEVAPNITQSLVSASVVNYCLALELFFKALIQVNGSKPPKIHKLYDLFNLIPDQAQRKIREDFEASIQGPKFDNFLSDISDYFQRVRYEYEYSIEVFYDGPIAHFAKIVYIYTAGVLDEKSNLPNVVA